MRTTHAAVQTCIHATEPHPTQCKTGKGNQVMAMLIFISRVSLPNSEILCLTRTPSLQNRLKTKEKKKKKTKEKEGKKGEGREKRQGEIKIKFKTKEEKKRKINS